MRSVTLLAVLGLASSAIPSNVLAQSAAMDLTLYHPRQEAPLSDQRIYKLTFSCNALANLTNGQASNIFIRENATSSHFIVINDKLMSSDTAGNTTVPTTGVAFFPVFAITKGVIKIDNRGACLSTQYITGGPELYLQAYANYSTQNEPGILLSLGYAVAGLIPPLWAMFNGKLSGPTKDQLTAFGNTEDPLKKTLSALNTEENYPVSRRLSPGDYEVRTAFSSVKINVKYVPSIINDGGDTAMKFFRKQIDTSPQKIDANNLGLCTNLAGDLVAIGFSKENDIPYALAYKGIRSGLTAAQASQCLGDDYAIAAASIKSGLWEFAGRANQVLTPKEATIEHPPQAPVPYQPDFDENRLKRFTDALSRLTRSEPVANSDRAAFSKTLKEPVTLDDESVSKLFGGEPKDYAAGADLAEFFVKSGYRRFGCYQATNLGQKLDGGKTLLFAFKADKDDATLSIENVALLKPIFNETAAVTKLVAYDDFDWITASMESRKWMCGRIAIKKPSQQSSPAVAASAPH
ncbi:hypothetical protein [Bradyrhizobium arachidis]|uniref:hypothetical protein n=1 Tax=Bradyrhizobium arachidis TaxID=858423 RepID=UPI0021618533|nr:hypothetical protein [Bradyrhizobium arachidis]UVO28143.1 hypothetical protein KUF59_37675 [Bradyrhizobium arachidis]